MLQITLICKRSNGQRLDISPVTFAAFPLATRAGFALKHAGSSGGQMSGWLVSAIAEVNNSWLNRLVSKVSAMQKSLSLLNYMTVELCLYCVFLSSPLTRYAQCVFHFILFFSSLCKEEAGLEKQQRRKAVGGPSFTKAGDVSP